jgi:hypothetical protein
MFLVPSLLCYCLMYIWTVGIYPGFLRVGQMLQCLSFILLLGLTFSHATLFYLCWFPIIGSIFGNSRHTSLYILQKLFVSIIKQGLPLFKKKNNVCFLLRDHKFKSRGVRYVYLCRL